MKLQKTLKIKNKFKFRKKVSRNKTHIKSVNSKPPNLNPPDVNFHQFDACTNSSLDSGKIACFCLGRFELKEDVSDEKLKHPSGVKLLYLMSGKRSRSD